MRRIVSSTLLALAVGPPLMADGYRFTRIDVPGAVHTEARGINARETIVGEYVDGEGLIHGFRLSGGAFSSIDVPEGSAMGGTRAINARGDVVGHYTDEDDLQRGFLLRDGQFHSIPYPVLGVNNAGDLVGNGLADDGETLFGWVLRDGVFETVLARVGNGVTANVWAIQDSGQVWVGTSTRSDGAVHGYLRSRAGRFVRIDFPGLPNPCTAPRSTNQRGDVVGFFALVDVPQDCIGHPAHGFLLREGQFARIDFPGSVATSVFAINDDGVLVGRFTDRQGKRHGFMAVPR
jgi:hypothetical protein